MSGRSVFVGQHARVANLFGPFWFDSQKTKCNEFGLRLRGLGTMETKSALAESGPIVIEQAGMHMTVDRRRSEPCESPFIPQFLDEASINLK